MAESETTGNRLEMFKNRTSYVGLYLTATGVALIIFTLLIDWMQDEHNSYVGLLLLIFVGLTLAGGAITLFGAWKQRRRTDAERAAEKHLNLNLPADRRKFYLLFFGGALLLNIALFASYTGYHYSEKSAFCGAVCHPMHPEYVAYQSSSHAHVECVACHVGPGLASFFKYKLEGIRQLMGVLLNNYPAPIPTPINNLRPARVVCEQCHWPGKFFGSKLVQRPYFLYDEKNTPEQITLGVKIGGRLFHSIHYNHIIGIKKMEYAALDPKEQDIPWIRVTRLDGKVDEYLSPDQKDKSASFAAKARVFDCIGCHNRPAHVFYAPDRAVNFLMAANQIPRDLPWIKKVAVEALSAPYPDQARAHDGIRKALAGYYDKQYPELARSRKGDIDRTVATVITIYDRNVFPDMKVNWQTHINNNGHRDWPGCFRCHDGRHVTKGGAVLNRECTLCHTTPVRGPLQPLGVMTEYTPGAEASWHPLSLAGKHGKILCSRCHLGGNPPPLSCTECHKINPKAPMISFGCPTCHQVPQELTGMTPCKECHTPKGLHTFEPHAETACIVCHKPHTWLVTGRDTCLECHGDRKNHNPGQACMTCHAFK